MSDRTSARPTVLVTDAYSASNVGDLELVRLSLEYATNTYPESEVKALAVDPDSFQKILEYEIVPRLFPRLTYLRASRSGKVLIALKWTGLIALLSILVLFPVSVNRNILSWAVRKRILPDTVELYLKADRVIAVGGGYLGDQYVKETLLTVWTWWWATRIGAHVETMPISVEVHGFLLRCSLGVFGRRVHWRVRDMASQRALEVCGCIGELLPDLAFSNFNRGGDNREGTVVALVGSDYLSEVSQSVLIENVVSLFALKLLPEPVQLVSMHSSLSSTAVGGDVLMSMRVESALLEIGVLRVGMVSAGRFSEVCEIALDAEVVLSARMHAGIAGLCSGAKVGLLAYETKHFALMDDLSLPDFAIDIESNFAEFENLAQRLNMASQLDFQSSAEDYYNRLRRAGLVAERE